MNKFSVKWILVCTMGVMCFSSAGAAQQSAAQTAADESFVNSNWQKAADGYSKVTAAEPANGTAWQNLGECFLQLRKYDEAIRAFQRAVEANFRPALNQVNVARVYAEKGERAQAFKIFDQVAASGEGGRLRPYIASSAEFARYKEDAQYKTFLEQIAPCKSAEYRQFDFWVGVWEVQDSAKNVLGQNLVTREQDGCLIIEHWKDSSGMQTGTSFNYYDIRDKKWHQLYLDNSGNAGAFPAMAGDLRGGKMVLITDEKIVPVSRWTWYAITPDRVRQMAEQTSDGGKSWQITWDSFYLRRPVQASK